MRIGIFTDTYPPFINGVSTSVFMLKKALEKKGHEVYVVTLNTENMHYKFDENKNYIQLDNGNIGRLMFGAVDSIDYPSTDIIWKEFKDMLLSYNPLDWDDMNFNYVYSEEDGVRLYKDFAEIYRIYRNKFDEVLKASKIRRLEKQLSKLKGEQSSENT